MSHTKKDIQLTDDQRRFMEALTSPDPVLPGPDFPNSKSERMMTKKLGLNPDSVYGTCRISDIGHSLQRAGLVVIHLAEWYEPVNDDEL